MDLAHNASQSQLEVTAKMGNNHPEILTGHHLKQTLLTKECRNHIDTGRKYRVTKGAGHSPMGSRLRLWRDTSAAGRFALRGVKPRCPSRPQRHSQAQVPTQHPALKGSGGFCLPRRG